MSRNSRKRGTFAKVVRRNQELQASFEGHLETTRFCLEEWNACKHGVALRDTQILKQVATISSLENVNRDLKARLQLMEDANTHLREERETVEEERQAAQSLFRRCLQRIEATQPVVDARTVDCMKRYGL